MREKTQQQKKNDHTLLAAAALVIAGLLAIGVPPVVLFLV